MRSRFRPTHATRRLEAGDSLVEGGFSLLELLVVVGLTAVISAIAVPMMSNNLGYLRLSGDARSLSNATSLARMQAASSFGQTRVYLDFSVNGYHIEIKTPTSPWTAQGGVSYLSSVAESYGFGVVSAAPPNTQTTIGQAPPCLNNASPALPIANTACIVFNSRGIPIDATGAPTGAYAVYLTDGVAVYGVTVSATSTIRLWRTNPSVIPSWVQQ